MIRELGLQVYIENDWGSRSVNVWIVELSGTSQFNISYDGESLIRTEIPEATPLNSNDTKPFLRLPKVFSDILFKSISEHLSESGIKTKNDHMIEGKLIAKEEHLKDMQIIVKKLLKINP